jgi:hypothetical protein
MSNFNQSIIPHPHGAPMNNSIGQPNQLTSSKELSIGNYQMGG